MGQKRKKIFVICVAVVVLLGTAIWAIQVIPVANNYKEERGNAKEFVSSWNARSDESDLLTNGVKISAASGDHVYSLGNGVTLKYTINSYWWVKYLPFGVVLEFSEEKQESVYEFSRSFLEVFDEIEDKDGMFARELEEVEPDKPTVITRFVVNNSFGVYHINFVEAAILKSNSVAGYSWNLTMEEWCENFNSKLDLAIKDAAQNSYSWVCDTEKEIFDAEVDPSVKDEFVVLHTQKYQPISAADFKKTETWTDGTHEFAIYVYRYPSWDSVLGQIALYVDENGYIFNIGYMLPQSLNDTINQYAGGDRRNYFMEFCGYAALACAGTGVKYSEALDAVNKFYGDSGITTLDLTDTVSVGATVLPNGLLFMYIPKGNFENWFSQVENWTVK